MMSKFIFSLIFLFGGLFIFQDIQALDSSNVFNGNGVLLEQKIDIKDYSDLSVSGQSCEGGKQIRCIIENIIEYLKKLLIPISIVLLMFSSLYLLIVRTNEEEFKKRKNEVFGIFAGFMIILLAATVIDTVFFGEQGEILRDGDPVWFAQTAIMQINGLINFLLTFVVPVGVLMLIFSAFKLIVSGGDDEEMGKIKKKIIYIIVGIIVILISKTVIDSLAGIGGIETIEAAPYVSIIVDWTNWLLGFVGVVAILALVWAGINMIAHFGDEERIDSSKNIIKFVIIGIIIAFSAWSIIRFFLLAGN